MAPTLETEIGQAFVDQVRRGMVTSLEKIHHCMDQMSAEDVWWRPFESHNSAGNILLHLAGNVRQWIICGVGQHPDVRNRAQEFSERSRIPKSELLGRLGQTIQEADDVLADLQVDQLLTTRRIQGFEETVLSALMDTLGHLKGHTQELIYITRLRRGEAYRFHWQPATVEQGALPANEG
jgi:hypothetical protein